MSLLCKKTDEQTGDVPSHNLTYADNTIFGKFITNEDLSGRRSVLTLIQLKAQDLQEHVFIWNPYWKKYMLSSTCLV